MPSYVVSIKTADQADAGTDSDIFLQMEGVKGKMPEAVRLNGLVSGDSFERDSTTIVTLKPGDLGPIARIRIRSDGSHPGSDWRLSFVDVRYIDAAAEQEALQVMQASLIRNLGDIATTVGKIAKLGVTTRFSFNRVITGTEKDPQIGEEGLVAFAENLVTPLGEPLEGTVQIVRADVLNALESERQLRRAIHDEVHLKSHLMVGSEGTLRTQVAAEAGWEAPSVSGKLSAELEHIRTEKEEQIRLFTIGRTVDSELLAKARTAQIEIRSYSVDVTAQDFLSSLSGPFVARWATGSLSEEPVITSFTFQKGRNMDTVWNDQIAMPLFLARPREYDGFVAAFKAAGILKNVKPLPNELRMAA